MTLADGQMLYEGSHGSLLFGPGRDIDWSSCEGLEGYATRANDRDVPRDDGAVPGLAMVTSRQILLELVWDGLGTPSGEERWETVVDTFGVERTSMATLTYKRPNRDERMVRCRPSILPRVIDPTTVLMGTTRLVLSAPDPRIYSADEHSVVVPIYTPTGSTLDFPLDFPLDFTAGSPAEAAAVNAGKAYAYPLVLVYGPTSGTLTGFTLNNQTTGGSITVTTTISSGEILRYDASAYVAERGDLVVSLDGAGRYSSWQQPRVPFALAPGENVLRFIPAGSGPNPQCLVTWRDTWLG